MQVIHGSKGGLIKAWVDGVPVEDAARQQLDLVDVVHVLKQVICVKR